MNSASPPARIVFFSDTHLGADFVSRQSGNSHRGDDFFSNFERVIDYAVSTQADVLVHAGDLFNRSQPTDHIMSLAYTKLLSAAESLKVLLLAGNHERSQLPPSLFLQHPNIYLFDKPGFFRFVIRNRSFVFGGFPFHRDIHQAFDNCISQSHVLSETADYKYLCMHQTVEGAKIGPVNFRFHRGRDVISAFKIPYGITAILSGHIHRRQILDTNSPVIYCGSTERTSFAEMNETKGFYVLIPEKSINNFIPLPTPPMSSLEIPGKLDPSAVEHRIRLWASAQSEGSILRIRFSERPDDIVLYRINRGWLSDQFTHARSVHLSVKGGWTGNQRGSALIPASN